MAVSTIDPNGLNIGQIGGRRNIVTNGAMTIQQRGTQTGQSGANYTACDRWQFYSVGGAVITSSQDTDVPSAQGFANSLKLDVTTADTSGAAADVAFLRTKFEGQDLQQICKGTSNAKQLTLSFWVKSPKTGTHIVELFDGDNTRQVSKTYTIDTANTWQYVSILYPADTTGSLNNDNGDSLQIIFWLLAGSNFTSGTLNTSWAANNNINRAVGQVNVMDDVANNFYLTGVQLELGDTATDFEHESYGTTLAKCQRYYQEVNVPQDYSDSDSNSNMYRSYLTATTMRTDGTATITSQISYFQGGSGVNITPTVNAYTDRVRIAATGLSTARGFVGGAIGLDAEL